MEERKNGQTALQRELTKIYSPKKNEPQSNQPRLTIYGEVSQVTPNQIDRHIHPERYKNR